MSDGKLPKAKWQKKTKPTYRGMTHPEKNLKIWKKKYCSKEMHLFDEVWSEGEHYLYCDACGLEVHIKEIKETND